MNNIPDGYHTVTPALIHRWGRATYKEDLTPEEMGRWVREAFWRSAP